MRDEYDFTNGVRGKHTNKVTEMPILQIIPYISEFDRFMRDPRDPARRICKACGLDVPEDAVGIHHSYHNIQESAYRLMKMLSDGHPDTDKIPTNKEVM